MAETLADRWMKPGIGLPHVPLFGEGSRQDGESRRWGCLSGRIKRKKEGISLRGWLHLPAAGRLHYPDSLGLGTYCPYDCAGRVNGLALREEGRFAHWTLDTTHPEPLIKMHINGRGRTH